MRRTCKRIAGLFLCGILTITMAAVSAEATKANKDKIDLDGTYHAALGISTATELWINRNAYYSKDSNASYDTENYSRLISEDASTKEKVVHDGTFTDVEIKGNGTYTVRLDGANFEGETTVCMLHVATDIPVGDGITFSNVVAKVNGDTVAEFEEPYMEDEEASLSGGQDIVILNHWRDELKQILSDKGVNENADQGYDLLRGAGEETVEVTFTVSGFNYDQVVETPAPTDDDQSTAAPADDQKDAKGKLSSATVGMIFLGVIVVVAVIAIVVISLKKKRRDY